MAENKKSFLFYVDWGEIFDELTDEEAGKLIKHMCDYVRDKNPEAPDRMTKAMFIQIKNTLKRDLDKWQLKSRKNSENAKMRWNKKNANASERIKRNANHADRVSDTVSDTDNVNVNVNVNVNDNVKETKVFSKAAQDCFYNCLKSFPENLHPKNDKIKNEWLDTIEKLNKIDNVPFETIEKISNWARNHEFWSGQFLSISKLRKNNKDGIKFIVVFNEQIKKNGTNRNSNTGTRAEQIARIYPELVKKHTDNR